MHRKVSDAVIRRLPRYYRQLALLEQEGVQKISSLALSGRMNITASQIRQDLNCFGGFGQQGYGYNVAELRRHIAHILGLTHQYRMIVVGAGNIGQALSHYSNFHSEGYDVLALFDTDPALIGQTIGQAKVLDGAGLAQFLAEHEVDIAAITVPAGAALAVARLCADAGIRAIWNFAPVDIVIPGVAVENAQLTDGLMALTYRLCDLKDEGEPDEGCTQRDTGVE